MKISIALLALFSLVITNSSVLATKHFVMNGDDSGNYSLRNRIETANPGDTICFAPGVDTVTLVSDQLLIHKSLYIKGNVDKTVVQRDPAYGTPEFRIFHFANCGDVQLENLIIANGQAPVQLGVFPQHGGGLCISDTSCNVKIKNCIISNNTSASGIVGMYIGNSPGGDGGGIYNNGFLTCDHCIFRYNETGIGGYSMQIKDNQLEPSATCINFCGGSGAGIANYYVATLLDCIIYSNQAGGGGQCWSGDGYGGDGGNGGGIFNSTNANIVLVNCIVCSNTSGQASAVYNMDTGSIDVGNPGSGGGIASPGNIEIKNSTIVNNHTPGFTYNYQGNSYTQRGKGGGIFTKRLYLHNSILSSNFDDDVQDDLFSYYPELCFINYTLVGSFSWTNLAGIGNLVNANPSFIDSSDFHLAFNSPCINAGDPDTSGLPVYDLEGNIRVIENRVDMGAYEFQGYSPDGSASVPGNIFIFPNPFHDRFTIFIPENLRNTVTDAAVHTLSGQIVFETTFYSRNADQEMELPSSLPKGIYLLVIRNTKACTIHKIIKL